MADTTHPHLEEELAELLEHERFEPSPAFRAQALITDLSVHEAAAKDPVGWWREQADALHWFSPPEAALMTNPGPSRAALCRGRDSGSIIIFGVSNL